MELDSFPKMNENLTLAFIIFIFSVPLFYWIFKKNKITVRGLIFVDLIWMITLILGVYFTIETIKGNRIKINIDSKKNELDFKYYSFIKELDWLKNSSISGLSNNYSTEEKDEFQKIINQVDILSKMALDGRESNDLNLYSFFINNLRRTHKEWIPKSNTVIASSYQKGLNERIDELEKNYKEIHSFYDEYAWTDSQQMLYFFYPWILSLIVGLRFSKVIYHYINFNSLTTK